MRMQVMIFSALLFVLTALPAAAAGPDPVVVLETSEGTVMVMLDQENAPVSVDNFLKYVDAGYYDGLIFHRVIEGFMIQGGGLDANYRRKQTRSPIKNEADNGLDNDRGTIAMARTNVVDSATSQFFINLVDNDFLNHKSKSPQGYGYAVFGKVIRGMKVVDKIGAVKTGRRMGMGDVPLEPIVIKRAYRHKG